jgi:putative transposase
LQSKSTLAQCGIIGKGLSQHIFNSSKKIDKLQSKITKTNTENNDKGYNKNKKQRQNLRKRCTWLRTKVRNIVNDHHWKAATYLCKNYKIIIIPKLNVKSLQGKIKMKYGSYKGHNLIRKMMLLSHGRFMERLKYKAKEYGRILLIVDESYTSQTCGKCGRLNRELGSSEIYYCKECSSILERDISAARNILIKTIS